MKKSYVSPAIEITEFKAEDIVRTSSILDMAAALANEFDPTGGGQIGGQGIATGSVFELTGE